MQHDAELLAWVQLHQMPGLGDSSVRRLLSHFGSAEASLAGTTATWKSLLGETGAAALGDATGRTLARQRADDALAWQKSSPQRHHLLTLADPAYPALLLETADPPGLLYALGDPVWLNQPAMAIVGSRQATAQGLATARDLAGQLGQAGWVVVSGLAAGIDGAAHEGALASRAGTIAVVGTGLDLVYPRRHLDLARRIAEQGMLLSEFALGTPSLAGNFPRRNRIIAGMSSGTLVIEAALQSGSLITARLASECGREVFAVPGAIQSAQSRGCHWLIKQGAKLTETLSDILEELPGGKAAPATERPPGEPDPEAPSAAPADRRKDSDQDDHEDEVLRAMGHGPTPLDELVARCGWPVDRLQVRLLELELTGRVARLPGGLLQRQAST